MTVKRLTNRAGLRVIPGMSDQERDEAVIVAAIALVRILEGAEIDAPGPVGDALRALGRAVERSGR